MSVVREIIKNVCIKRVHCGRLLKKKVGPLCELRSQRVGPQLEELYCFSQNAQ